VRESCRPWLQITVLRLRKNTRTAGINSVFEQRTSGIRRISDSIRLARARFQYFDLIGSDCKSHIAVSSWMCHSTANYISAIVKCFLKLRRRVKRNVENVGGPKIRWSEQCSCRRKGGRWRWRRRWIARRFKWNWNNVDTEGKETEDEEWQVGGERDEDEERQGDEEENIDEGGEGCSGHEDKVWVGEENEVEGWKYVEWGHGNEKLNERENVEGGGWDENE
jgi:hypothetical protein